MTQFIARGIPRYCLIAIGMLLAQSALAADTLLINGHVFTGDTHKPWAEALALKGAEIEAVGSNREMQSHRTAQTKVIDLHGHTVVPGFVDAHTHMLFGALDALYGINLATPAHSIDPVNNPELLVQMIRDYAAKHPDEKVILGRSDFATVQPRTPSTALLDRAVPDRPVVIHNTSEHALWVNSKALELAQLTDQPLSDPSEERGVIRDASGHPTGVLVEAAMEVMERAALPLIPLEDKLARIKAAAHYFNSFGTTSIVNATGSLAEIELYGMLRDRGELTVRTRTAFGAVAYLHHLTPAFLADLETARQRFHDDWVAANLVKFFMDGATGSYPPLVYTAAEYRQLVTELDRRGFQLMSHALRPDSVRLVLDTYATLEATNGKRERRLRIEHADRVYNSDMQRFKTIGVIASMQPSFCCYAGPDDWEVPDIAPIDPWDTFEKVGAVVAFDSDWPCTFPPDPLVSIQEATTRQVWREPDADDMSGAGQSGGVTLPLEYTPQEKVTVQQAVVAWTMGSAYAAFHDDRLGSLVPGKLADLAVLSKDIFSIPPETISTARVVMTMVGGKVVFGEPPTM